MTANNALFQFFNGFGIPAYPVTAVPEKAQMPYITYDQAYGFFDSTPFGMVVDIWYKTESEAVPTEKAVEIAETIRGGYDLPVDGGCITLIPGSPPVRAVADEDNSIKRRRLNITAIFYL